MDDIGSQPRFRAWINRPDALLFFRSRRSGHRRTEMTRWNTGRLAGAILLALALGVAAPAMAIDTGGADNNTPAPSSPAKPKPAHSSVPTLDQARAEIDAKNWTKAIADLKLIVASSSSNADAYNLLGYSYRNAGNYDLAGKAYGRALKLNPKHTGALEYQGVLFIKLGQTDKAKANLDKIKAICGTTCEAYQDLNKALG
jgi:tetratricopeptide (TPR) repeat protein